ncbi:nucleoside hydrolase [Leptolyngbya sp. FACHB-711]|uniref:nucleoside hydrolase n=1 Tax=unclassified Leptolyngbya TaxID=2650499 RepID=UPI0016843EFA|nr:nucleoside hydrolase [Leptolyngbya sp. FACHB-711]MBD1850034.1 nucleoside hydrolase [Cyanobacteria bacterium FACHB-502]MBD2025042.1 nucleoside hydrolase [Leptolyngbya sp. FACHB-711]
MTHSQSIPQKGIPQIILDTDPGGDDTFAFLWLLSLVKRGFADLIAVTTADGNVAAQKTFSNSSQILSLAGFSQIEVGRGVPVQGAIEDASSIHGPDGMGNLSETLPAATHAFETARRSDDVIIDRLNAMPGEVTIVAIGPLTNLAAAEAKQPGILKQAKEIIVMGGAFLAPGNVTPHAEFNIWFNAVAAQTVFNSRDDLVVMPLDVTQHLIFTRQMAQAVVTNSSHRSPIAQLISPLCEFMIGTATGYCETRGIPGFLVHDAATIGYLFYPESFLLQRATVKIEIQGEWTIGQTLIDRRHTAKPGANAWVAMQVNAEMFFTSFLQDLIYLMLTITA